MECGECTACCTLLLVPELNKAAGEPCVHLTPKGCSIYEDRPQSCRDLSCAYHMVDNANVAMRPDNSGVVFEKVFDDLMFGTVNPKGKPAPYVQGQIRAFRDEGINTILAKSGVTTMFPLEGVDPTSLMTRLQAVQ